jgi:hypothetical protein
METYRLSQMRHVSTLSGKKEFLILKMMVHVPSLTAKFRSSKYPSGIDVNTEENTDLASNPGHIAEQRAFCLQD